MLFFQFMETFKLVLLPIAIIVFVKEHPKLPYLFAASLGNNDQNSYCITSLGKEKFNTSYFRRSRTNKAWPSEHVFCSPCAHSHCSNIISSLSHISFPFSTKMYLVPIACALLYPQVCSALAPAASPPAFPLVLQYPRFSPYDLCRSCGWVKKQWLGSKLALGGCRLADQVLPRWLAEVWTCPDFPAFRKHEVHNCFS